jgi:lipopolysaccharide transport system ATP-binding protein
MSDVVVQVEQLGKCYQIAHRRERKDSLGEAVAAGVRGLGRGLRGLLARRERMDRESFWALRDVSFQVRRGEVLALIGRNGAGKSTLLKLLARITEPTVGRFGLRGRVSSLLEVGTGFHPELTGRENVYLNGAILGMRRAEISRKFDEIVAFAEVEQFLDTPVKRYSSGMYTRLAFSVAAHLEPEILIVDEVLAVGDVAFQKKCMGKMSAVAKQDRTILFVSHNMSSVRALCTRGIILDHGRIVMEGTSHAAADAYLKAITDRGNMSRVNISETALENRKDRASGAVRFTAVRLEDDNRRERSTFLEGETVRILLSYRAYKAVPNLAMILMIRTAAAKEEWVTTIKTVITEERLSAGDKATLCVTLPTVPLRPGDYAMTIYLGKIGAESRYDAIDDNVSLPHLTITSEDDDVHKMMGCFSIPWRLSIELAEMRD